MSVAGFASPSEQWSAHTLLSRANRVDASEDEGKEQKEEKKDKTLLSRVKRVSYVQYPAMKIKNIFIERAAHPNGTTRARSRQRQAKS